MKLSLILAGILVIGLSVPTEAQDHAGAKFALPENPQTVVISLDQQNGFTPPRKNSDPMLSILSNGTVLVPDVFGKSRDVQGSISRKELQDLLKFILNDNQFAKISAKQIKADMQRVDETRNVPRIADLPDTIITVKLAESGHSVRQESLGHNAGFYKEVEDLQRLDRINRRLQLLMSEIRVGGKEKLRKLVEQANARLGQEHPEIAPLSISDFRGSYIGTDQVTSATLLRTGRTPDGKPNGSFVSVIVKIPLRGDLTFQIRRRGKP